MPGLDTTVLTGLDHKLALKRIRTDSFSDFIHAPHYGAVFDHMGDELWERLRRLLSSGSFEPSLPISLEVPRPSGITRPGTILPPTDRLAYQLLVDLIAPTAATQLDPERSYGYALTDPDPTGQMFEPAHDSWARLMTAVRSNCEHPHINYAVRADVASYFEAIDQHALINLVRASGPPAGAANLLEELLAAWRERNSRGLLQGMFPSDFLGNFYLCSVDGELEVAGIPSVRYMDDIYMFFTSKAAARTGLVNLCRWLRRSGLFLNEKKTAIHRAQRLVHEETRVDELFAQAREAAEQQALANLDFYGFQARWDFDPQDFMDTEEVEASAFENLFACVAEPGVPADKIERFCLPFLGAIGSPIAIDRATKGIVDRPYQAKLYASYLSHLFGPHPEVVQEIEKLWVDEGLSYDWQRMWLAASLAFATEGTVAAPSVTLAMRNLQDFGQPPAVRAVCAQIVAKHGNAARKRALRTIYSDEPSPYVRSALVFSTRYFGPDERRACLKAWGGALCRKYYYCTGCAKVDLKPPIRGARQTEGAAVSQSGDGGHLDGVLVAYGWHPEPGSPEARLAEEFLKPQDWLR